MYWPSKLLSPEIRKKFAQISRTGSYNSEVIHFLKGRSRIASRVWYTVLMGIFVGSLWSLFFSERGSLTGDMRLIFLICVPWITLWFSLLEVSVKLQNQ